MKKGTSKITWMPLELPIIDITNMSRVSIFQHCNELEYATKMRLLAYVAKNWDRSKCYMDATAFTVKAKQNVKDESMYWVINNGTIN